MHLSEYGSPPPRKENLEGSIHDKYPDTPLLLPSPLHVLLLRRCFTPVSHPLLHLTSGPAVPQGVPAPLVGVEFVSLSLSLTFDRLEEAMFELSRLVYLNPDQFRILSSK